LLKKALTIIAWVRLLLVVWGPGALPVHVVALATWRANKHHKKTSGVFLFVGLLIAW